MGEISVRAHGLAIYDRRLAPVTAALHLGLRIPARDFRPVPHDPRVVGWAAEIRDLHLADVARADVSRGVLRAGSRARLERRVALQMIGALLDALGAKNDEAALAAMVDLLEGDAIALASKLWEPINASPTALALAARKLIATQVFSLKPAELADACREAAKAMDKAEDACERLVEQVRQADAVLLAFAYDRWREPYLTPQFRPVLPRMLDLHEIFGDGGADFDEGRPNAFGDAIERAKADLLPELIEGSADPS
jgi:hypothetical protein